MSKIGKQPIKIKENATVAYDSGVIKITGAQGTLVFTVPQGIVVGIEDDKIMISQKNGQDSRALFGLTRAIIANMIKGVAEGFSKKLELSGVGYRAQVSGNNLILSVGFSHPVAIKAQDGIKFMVSENIITVFGADKTIVGDTAAKIRAIRPPEPYKGKGIKYMNERIRRKAGKAAKAVGAK